MSSKIIASTTSGTALNMSADTSGILEIQTGSGPTTAIYCTSGQNVGIGTSTINAKLALANNVGTAGVPSSLIIYDDGATANNEIGLGVSSGLFNVIAGGGTGLAFYTNGTSSSFERMRLDTSGNLMVGTTSVQGVGQYSGVFDGTAKRGAVYVNSTTFANTNYVTFFTQSTQVGTIVGNGAGGVSYSSSSDYRLKENVKPITNGLEKVLSLNPVNFDWIATKANDSGFLAHEFQAVVPNSVTGEKDGIDKDGKPEYQAMDNSGAIPFLVAAIQELNAKVTALEAQLGAK